MNIGFSDQQKNELAQIVSGVVDQKLESALKPIKKDLSKLKKDMKTVINHFDHENIDLDKRVLRVENHLNLPPIQ